MYMYDPAMFDFVFLNILDRTATLKHFLPSTLS